jgi:hypothetical protein
VFGKFKVGALGFIWEVIEKVVRIVLMEMVIFYPSVEKWVKPN